MDVFSEIEGLSGENLGSALLRYLIFNSQEARESILSLFSDKSPFGPITYSTHFACRTEYPTSHTKYGDGRLDLLIQLDDVVIGVENKFFAQFQKGQPEKYLETLEQVATLLKTINKAEVKVVLYIVCPESRKNEAHKLISGLKNTRIITWQDLLSRLRNLKEISNPTAKVVLGEFIKYLERHFSFIRDFERKFPHYRGSFPNYGTPLQRELVGKLWSFFPTPGPSISNGKDWVGYYFYSDSEIKETGWFGFVPQREISSETNNKSELIIASTYRPELSNSFISIKLNSENFIGAPGRTNAWIINFDNRWNTVEKWSNELAPFWDVINDAIDGDT